MSQSILTCGSVSCLHSRSVSIHASTSLYASMAAPARRPPRDPPKVSSSHNPTRKQTRRDMRPPRAPRGPRTTAMAGRRRHKGMRARGRGRHARSHPDSPASRARAPHCGIAKKKKKKKKTVNDRLASWTRIDDLAYEVSYGLSCRCRSMLGRHGRYVGDYMIM